MVGPSGSDGSDDQTELTESQDTFDLVGTRKKKLTGMHMRSQIYSQGGWPWLITGQSSPVWSHTVHEYMGHRPVYQRQAKIIGYCSWSLLNIAAYKHSCAVRLRFHSCSLSYSLLRTEVVCQKLPFIGSCEAEKAIIPNSAQLHIRGFIQIKLTIIRHIFFFLWTHMRMHLVTCNCSIVIITLL